MMISEHLSKIDGISIFPEVSLILFFFFFAVAIIWVLRLDKKHIIRMGNLPLESNSENNPEVMNSQNNSEIKDEVN